MKRTDSLEIRCLDDAKEISLVAAEEFLQSYLAAREAGSRFRVALSGGSTPRLLHKVLCAAPYPDKITWREIDFFFGDERTVAPSHKDSNYRMAYDTLFGELEVDRAQIHRMRAEETELDAAARSYEGGLAATFGVSGCESGGPTPHFDLILLGIGSDGHTASLFPGTSALGEDERWVVANCVPQLDCSRMTFTYPLINAAKKVVFMISGEGKRSALEGILEGAEADTPYPARRISPSNGELLFLIDRAAGAGLTLDPPNPGGN